MVTGYARHARWMIVVSNDGLDIHALAVSLVYTQLQSCLLPRQLVIGWVAETRTACVVLDVVGGLRQN